MKFFSILLAGLVATPIAADTNFQILGTTSDFVIEVDMNSIITTPKLGGYEVRTIIKRNMNEPVDVRGKKKKGYYYLEKTVVRCAQEDFTVEDSTLFSKDGEILAHGKVNDVYANPKIPNHFVTVYIDIICNNNEKLKPSILISV